MFTVHATKKLLDRVSRWAMGTIEALDSGDSSTELRLAYEYTQRRPDDDDLGLESAINGLNAALRSELPRSRRNEGDRARTRIGRVLLRTNANR